MSKQRTYTVEELAKILKGEWKGQGSFEISGVTNLSDATAKDISFAVPPHLDKAQHSHAGALIVPVDWADQINDRPVIAVANPRLSFIEVLELFQPPLKFKGGVHSTAVVGENVQLGKNVTIMAHVVIADNVVIGDNSILYPHVYVGHDAVIGASTILYPSVTLRENCQIGNNSIIHANAVIGSDGFGFVTTGGKHRKVPQVGNVVIGSQVEIGANVAIDRATTGSTVVKDGTKIDNLVHLGHNVVIGEDCFLVAQTGIAGSVTVGNHVTFAGQTGSAGHVKIGDNCTFAARAAVISDVPPNSFFAGFPARPHRDWLKAEAAMYRVPDLIKKVREMEKELKELKTYLAEEE